MAKLIKIFFLVLITCLLLILAKNEFARFLTKKSPYGIQTLIVSFPIIRTVHN